MKLPTVAPYPYNTYDHAPEASEFVLTSSAFDDGGMLPPQQRSGIFGVDGGMDESPPLSWSGFPPDETKSFVVTCYDPDAPVVSGFWHWVVYDVPADVTSLEAGAGKADGDGIAPLLPDGAKVLRNDAGMRGYVGAAAPPDHGMHRYQFVVTAMACERIPGLPEDGSASPALLHSRMNRNGIVGRAILTGLFGR